MEESFIAIGYACLVIGERGTQISGCRLKNASVPKLRELTAHNLSALDRIIEYNIKNGIQLFRISSDIIPFGSHPGNLLDWKKEYANELARIGNKIKEAGLRVSMHPGQYTVLNSPNPAVVENALRDIAYHADFLDALLAGPSSKIVLHVGGAYGDKEKASDSFIRNALRLPQEFKHRIVLENDDKSFTVQDVLKICGATGIPTVFDNLHHKLNPPIAFKPEPEWIALCGETWRSDDGRQKIHYSQPGETPGAHSKTINVEQFLDYYNRLPHKAIDVMLEVKDKNCSAMKCILAAGGASLCELEQEWARYKYLVLSKSAAIYNDIREMLKSKNTIAAAEFYSLVDRARALPEDLGSGINAAQHVWGYFKKNASSAEKRRFDRLLDGCRAGNQKFTAIKNFLFQCTWKYNSPYLQQSYYFYLA